MSCFGHNLHLAVTKAINNDSRSARVLKLCHKVVSAFSVSWKRRRDLRQTQLDLNLPQHSMISVCQNRTINYKGIMRVIMHLS